ncbi:MAG: Nramp family divalent metal transporter [Xanthomonadales bacterium]|nr:Nramp family divalent metal transporter [Xanthomonadales bacterium]
MIFKKLSIGPAVLVAAAFIGPGTVTTATLAGANFGYALIWALVFSVAACIVLQEMAARLGVVAQQGLGETLREVLVQPLIRYSVFVLVTVAIFIGNSAYQGGNIAGASLGLDALFPKLPIAWPLLISLLTFSALITGSYKLLEKALLGLVFLMSLAFFTTFVLTKPDMAALFSGVMPSLPDGAILTVIALIGTTVVPYNLFLHASFVSNRWSSPEDLPKVRKDIYFSIGLGGLLSIAVISTAAAAFFNTQISIQSAADMSVQLEPLLGSWARISMGVGLFAAGISSAVTAPLAAAYAITGILGWSSDLKSRRFRMIWLIVLLIGLVLASSGYRPLTIIWFAQIANGILLPLMAGFLLYVMNQSEILGRYKNTLMHNLLGLAVILVTLVLSAKSLWSAFS